MGYFSSITEFIDMGGHGRYVWLSYAIGLIIILVNVGSVIWNRRQFFAEAKRRLRREQRSS
jgi:heme exporter protein D